MSTKLKFGVLCSSLAMERWQEKTISKLLEVKDAELSLIILNNANMPVNDYMGINTKQCLSNLLFCAYYKLVKNRSKSRRIVDMSSVLHNIPRVVCRPEYDCKHSISFSKSDVENIKKHELDFILNFSYGNPSGDILQAAGYGVWAFRHDDEMKYRGGPPCFWEIYNNDKITGALLERLIDAQDGGVILNKGYFPTFGYSYIKNLDRTLFSSAEWPAKVCRSIINGSGNISNKSPYNTDASHYKLPGNIQMIKFLFQTAYKSLEFVFNYLFRNDEWNIGIIEKPIHTVLNGDIEPKWLPSPERGTFIADPFGKSINGKTFVMVEDLDYHTGSANISAMEISDLDKRSYTKRSAVRLPCHMSYPYLIDYNKEIYLIPETYQNRSIVLLKAIDFPNVWEEVSTLVHDFAAVDPTVFFYNNLWWLMCTNRDTDSNSDLYIWYSKDLFGPWAQHSANPVKTDIKSSRPGGTPFAYNGELYRPAQNSVFTYGGSLFINRITKLTVNEFEEEEVLEIKPDKKSIYNKGIHTIASMGDMTVVDGKRFVFIPDLLLHRCIGILKRVKVPQPMPRL